MAFLHAIGKQEHSSAAVPQVDIYKKEKKKASIGQTEASTDCNRTCIYFFLLYALHSAVIMQISLRWDK